jgi:hypothetical protein
MKTKIKRDKFYRSRGGRTNMLQVSCAACASPLLHYQKDGNGNLHRFYLDRISHVEPFLKIPEAGPGLMLKMLPNLVCKCGQLFAVPMVYERERRLAFRILHSHVHKTKIA